MNEEIGMFEQTPLVARQIERLSKKHPKCEIIKGKITSTE